MLDGASDRDFRENRHRDVVQSLWIGNRLSVMERLCIRSFLDNGHPFHLYAYEEIEGVPEGTVVRDGREILPAEEIFVYQRGCGKGSPSAFSNFFRYKLLLERGGWWADLDAVCTRPLEFAEEHVTAYEREDDGRLHLAVGLMKAPPQSPIIEFCWNECQQVDKTNLGWGEIGPRLFARAVETVGTPILLLPPEAFYPIDHWQFRQLLHETRMPTDGYSIHLWNAKWRRKHLDPDAIYDPRCIYEQLKRRHGIESPPGATRGEVGWLTAGTHCVKRFVDRFRSTNNRRGAA